MNSRERVRRALTFNSPDRIPRDLWILPVALDKYEKEVNTIQEKFPSDIGMAEYNPPLEEYTRGDSYRIGTYVDEWGCRFENIQEGMYGEVKEPLVKDWSSLSKVEPPYGLLGKGMEEVDRSCRKSDKFMLGRACPRPFERMQFLRGTSNLLMDIMDQPPEFFELQKIVHEYYLKELEVWVDTEVDALMFMDDWGSQKSLLINPDLWRKLFKPLYKDYSDLIHRAGKFAFMHSDGHIFDIYEDLIEIGVDAVNSQLFCMNIEEIGKRFKGRITFWGEVDRQHILPSEDQDEVRRAVRRIKRSLYDPRGGLIIQCEFGAEAKPENVEAVFEEGERMGRTGISILH